MKVEVIKYPTEEELLWCKQCTLNTVGKTTTAMPSLEWLTRLIKAEHSPIRELRFGIKLTVPYWISVHFVRHHVGVDHYISTQREDRTNEPRENKPQGAMVTHIISCNAQSLINMAHKRLCRQAHPETRKVMRMIVDAVVAVAPYMKESLVPLCVYRGGKCTELHPCHTP